MNNNRIYLEKLILICILFITALFQLFHTARTINFKQAQFNNYNKNSSYEDYNEKFKYSELLNSINNFNNLTIVKYEDEVNDNKTDSVNIEAENKGSLDELSAILNKIKLNKNNKDIKRINITKGKENTYNTSIDMSFSIMRK